MSAPRPFRLLVTALSAEAAPDIFAELAEAGIEAIEAAGQAPLTEQQLRDLLPGVDGVWAAPDAYTERALEVADRLKVIARWGVGIESIDLAAATRRGIVVTNAPGATTESVADYTFGLIIDLARRITTMHNLLREGRWERLWGVDVWRKTLGIVGFGHIGRGVARRAQGFEMTTLAFDPYCDRGTAAQLGVEMTTLEDLLARSDFVTLHATLTPETRGLIGEAELRRMRSSAYLVNCGRGPLVVTDALVRALREGWIAGAAVDVYDEEPVSRDHPLLSIPNCLTLPHCASLTYECARVINRINADDLLAVVRGERPRFVCNPEVYRLGS